MSDSQEPPASGESTGKKRVYPVWFRVLTPLTPLLILLLAAPFVAPVLQDTLAPERRVLTPPAQVFAPDRPAARPPAPDDPALVKSFGSGAIAAARRDVQRIAVAAADAAACRLRDAAWITDVRSAIGPAIAARYNSFERKPDDAVLLARFAAGQFNAAQMARSEDPSPVPPRDCADLPSQPDFRAADVMAADQRSRRAAPR